ncbi:FliI/YscN family ATPase [Teredinibacter sp. KSP-S5-2]|uniref:FliI/YscN family ATPase n=1 Tax=Teredinibacter sp. KSP-S5-2 TaxID=3034506 RepID=UPI0029346592|nr:FliI/YscN family ATPase [Teredinibacter sp. KSP-S5-2]WNO11337.1 FliI/YscN family ATPase [Teredinibacter sp. KSP-S5-2]
MKKNNFLISTDRYINAIRSTKLGISAGRLTAVHGTLLEASGCDVLQGELVEIIQARSGIKVLAEVVGLRDGRILLMPFGNSQGLCLNSRVIPLEKSLDLNIGDDLLGSVIDPLGNPLDNRIKTKNQDSVSTHSPPINPLHRVPINECLHTGVTAIDLFCPLGRGQRIGIFAGSGVGKSTLLGMIAANTDADVVVIALVGERGREVIDFIDDSLGTDGLRRSVVVVATADQPAVLRKQATYSATAIAEWFRKKNKNVLLIMDSITRFAMAQREIGLSTGEPIGTRGYPASVFSLLPPLLERGGTIKNQGTITSIYTVLVEGDDMNEPISDHMRSLLDGHIVLSRTIASKNQYPAIDIPNSLSRLIGRLFDSEQKKTIGLLRKQLSVYSEAQDMIELGAYIAGSNSDIDNSLLVNADIIRLVTQLPEEKISKNKMWQHAKTIQSILDQ